MTEHWEKGRGMKKDRKLILVGDSAFAEVAWEYFTYDSSYEVCGFVVEREYRKRSEFHGLPVVALEEVEQHFTPSQHSFYAALVYTSLNRLRTRLYDEMKRRGYAPASYVSSHAVVWPSATLGEHCFVFENNVVQPQAVLGDNVVLWSGNHIGHHSRIGDNCFISSHVVISGFCRIGANCFLGVNSSTANNVIIGDDCVLGAGAVVAKALAPGSVTRPAVGKTSEGARLLYGVRE